MSRTTHAVQCCSSLYMSAETGSQSQKIPKQQSLSDQSPEAPTFLYKVPEFLLPHVFSLRELGSSSGPRLVRRLSIVEPYYYGGCGIAWSSRLSSQTCLEIITRITNILKAQASPEPGHPLLCSRTGNHSG